MVILWVVRAGYPEVGYPMCCPVCSCLLPAAAGLLGIVRAERPRHVLSVGFPVLYSKVIRRKPI